jgi:dihydroneopterin aldolase
MDHPAHRRVLPAGALGVSNGFLASVRNMEEAVLALDHGADIVDFKEPASGALGALPVEVIRSCLGALAGRVATSATIGDVELEPDAVLTAVQHIASTSVDYVKIGLFEGDLPATLAALVSIARRRNLIAVMFADRSPDLAVIDQIADAGFAGIMLDTADKSRGSLTTHLPVSVLAEFIQRGHARGMLVGLAGSLRYEDIALLGSLGADYLGFRSALTLVMRAGPLSGSAVAAIRQALDDSSKATAAAAAASATRSASPLDA